MHQGTQLQMTKRAKTIAVHPASATDQVLTVVGGGGSYRGTVCGGCPWRIDQTGQFSAESFRISAHTAYDAAFNLFGCHESGAKKPATCAGFLIRNSMNNIGARLKGISGVGLGVRRWSNCTLRIARWLSPTAYRQMIPY